ncbi:DUF1146 domain-containing protein [Vagococcus coleopterorum]|uniref:DUF1146 domain-containing protein n=1 Tax=Vagococcus coleopterorum TaxID=2714946 RepID=A0A6G8AP24_9ENTE|nr:DUF1146 family protein [Vagococcus coleopterorum]QIL46673.1 DUF1146 domain-containing protein [Vagococcus coleopterorum]
MQVFGIDALVRLVCHLLFVYMAYWALQGVRIESFFKKQTLPQIKFFILFFAIAIGYMTSSFFLECITLIRNFIISVV